MKRTKAEWKALSDRVMLTLRPTQYPVVMKFIKTEEEFEAVKNVTYCQNKASCCKLIGMAAHCLGTFGLTPDHFSGWYCATNNGCWPVEERYLEGKYIATPPLCWHHDVEDSKKHIQVDLKMLPEKPYLGIICANMAECEVEEADVISLQLPTQAAFHLMAGYVEQDYEQVHFQFSGESNCIDTWMRTLKEKKIGLSLGCRGDRATGALGYGEVRITMTTEQLLRALDGADRIVANGIDYPYNPTCMLKSAF